MKLEAGVKVQFKPWKELKHTPYVRDWMEKYAGLKTIITSVENRAHKAFYAIDMVVPEARDAGDGSYSYYWMEDDFNIIGNDVTEMVFNVLLGKKVDQSQENVI